MTAWKWWLREQEATASCYSARRYAVGATRQRRPHGLQRPEGSCAEARGEGSARAGQEAERAGRENMTNSDIIVTVSAISAGANMAICLYFFARIKRRLDCLGAQLRKRPD
jgi:hypothetical protein